MKVGIKNVLLLILLIVYNPSPSNTLKSEKITTKIVNYIKSSDRQTLLTFLTSIENQVVKLISNREDHSVSCEKTIQNCRSKFSHNNCEIIDSSKIKQFKFTKHNAVKELLESKNYYLEVEKTVIQNKQDCYNEKKIYENSVFKLDSDIKLVKKLTETIVIRHKEVEKQIEIKRKIAEAKAKEKARKAAEAKKILDKKQVQTKKKQVQAKKKKVQTKKKPEKKSPSKTKKLTVVVNKKTPVPKVAAKSTTKKATKKAATSAPSPKASSHDANQTKAIQMESSMTNNNINQRLIQNNSSNLSSNKNQFKLDLSSFLSLIQLEQEKSNNNVNNIPVINKIQTSLLQKSSKVLSHINSKLKIFKKFKNLGEENKFLELSLKDLEIVLNSLTNAKNNLEYSFIDTNKSCIERLKEYKEKRKHMQNGLIESKLELEKLNSKQNFEEKKSDLCKFTKRNYLICEEISQFCKSYKEEYDSEIQELKELMKVINNDITLTE